MENSSILSHVSIGTNNYPAAVAFYDAVLPSLGIKKIMQHEGSTGYGKVFPEFFVNTPHDGNPASVGNGTHVSFLADSPALVDAFYAAALSAGAQSEGAPGPRPHYGIEYYGAFVRDVDGHKIEAMPWNEAA